MQTKCYTTMTGKSVFIEVNDQPWYISIKSNAGERFDPFFEYDQKEVKAADIETFIPNWSRLSWQAPTSSVGYCKTFGADVDFILELHCSDRNLHQEEVINSFLTFMCMSSLQ